MRKELHCLILLVLLTGLGSLQAQSFIQLNINQASQLVAQAGTDQLICPGDTVGIGGSQSAQGGTSPYNYSWNPATGLSSSTTSNPAASPAQTTSYTLQITDAAGCTAQDIILVEIDTCVGLNPELGVASFEVYPNPSQGKFTVAIQGDQVNTPLKVQIVSLLGQVIEQRSPGILSGELKMEFDLKNLARGTYLVEVWVGENRISRRIAIH
ncbi:MAG: T9SS type A sorting domain-containing protein [Bacteroidia bacterium]|nr:T9SS type A sorting domain-containing protein [Bacteroidia bacterium]